MRVKLLEEGGEGERRMERGAGVEEEKERTSLGKPWVENGHACPSTVVKG